MNEGTKKTFDNLRKQTFSLIGSFYEVPAEIKGIFADMMAIYEANPTKENAKAICDVIMGRGAVEDKKKWIEDTVKTVPGSVRFDAHRKYIGNQKAVPAGAPTSGMLLVGLGIVPKQEKDLLVEKAQAAARLISHIDNMLPNPIENKKGEMEEVKYQARAKQEDYKTPDGAFENAFLDKPFIKKLQRLEHLVNVVVNDIYTQNADKKDAEYLTKNICNSDSFLRKARDEAIDALIDVALDLEKTNPEVSKKITALVKTLNKGDCKKKENPLTKEDYDALKKQVEGRPIAELVEHRISQIIPSETKVKETNTTQKTDGLKVKLNEYKINGVTYTLTDKARTNIVLTVKDKRFSR